MVAPLSYWAKAYGGKGDDVANALAIAPNGDIIVAGYTESFGAGGSDVWVLRLPPDGELEGFGMSPDRVIVKDSHAISKNTNAKVSGGYWSELTAEEHQGIFMFLRKRKKKAKAIQEAIQVMPSNASVSSGKLKETVVYTTSDSRFAEFWRNLANGRLERAAELFDSLYPPISGNLVEFFVPVTFALEKRYESKDIAEILLGVLNPYLNELRVRIELRDDEKFSPEEKSFTLTLRKGEKFVKRVRVKRLEDTEWYWFEAIFRVENYEEEFVKWLSLMDEGEVLFRWALVETESKKKIELLKKAASMGHEEAKKELLRRFIKPLKQGLSRSFVVEIPRLVEGVESIMRMSIKNDFAEQLKLTVSLSGNDFLELDEEEIEFPKLGREHKVSKKVRIKPKYTGKFGLKLKLNATVDDVEFDMEKTIPVEVVEDITTEEGITTNAQPTPVTPQPAPVQFQLSPDFPPQLAHKYTSVELIGKGGFARVYRAKRKDGKVVAVKIPLSLDENTGRAFLREITNWLHLKHPNIVRLYDANILPIPYLEMEYCESSLEKLSKPLSIESAAYIIFNVAEGLKYAHSKGIVHRDLKPSNILLKAGVPKVSDWGLSKVLSESRYTTYAAPEQVSRRFGKPDHRSDIWQLGVVFYELVTGRLPFEGDDLIEVVSSITMEEPVPPSELNPEAKEIEHIILTCLQKDMGDRYQSMGELQFELATYLGLKYRKGLKQSITLNNTQRAAFYAGKLMLVFLKMGNLKEAYKYASNLKVYAKEVTLLNEQIKIRLEEGLSAPEELVERAEVIVHKISLGFKSI